MAPQHRSPMSKLQRYCPILAILLPALRNFGSQVYQGSPQGSKSLSHHRGQCLLCPASIVFDIEHEVVETRKYLA